MSPLWTAVAEQWPKIQICVDNMKKNKEKWVEKSGASNGLSSAARRASRQVAKEGIKADGETK